MQNISVELKKIADEELVAQAQQGDNTAFAELVRRHQTSCFKLALSILRDRSDAEDEVQNALWKAYEHISQFNQESKFSTWLTRIVVNQCLMRLRKMKRARLVYLEDAVQGEDQVALDLPEQSDTPEEALGKIEVGQVLRGEISRIPPLLRHVFLLRDVQQLPMADVAEQLGISIAAAKSRLLRARLELRTRLERHEGRLGAATLMA
ncbi:MAG: sigma-70 family RNA polymerase sigma factor [Acidobacteria bacterium]|nr:sigma-70 family RNA polymerase sigma factor [Acidobacteriota bacterium]